MPEKPLTRPSKPTRRETQLGKLFGTVFRPYIALCLDESARVAWAHPECSHELENAIPEVLAATFQAETAGHTPEVWGCEEWRQAMGLAPADWSRRVLLLCRAQLTSRDIADPATTGGKGHRLEIFIRLPDGEAVGTVLFWPRQQSKLTNPLRRLPESVTLYALREVIAKEQSQGCGSSNDGVLGGKLTKWLSDHGLGERWFEVINGGPVSAKQIANFRGQIANFRGNEGDIIRAHLPTMTERQQSAP